MADESLEDSAEALMSLKSGGGKSKSPTKTSPSIPRRDNPPRIRKKNKRIFNDDEDTSMSPIRSPSKKLKIVAPVHLSPKSLSSQPSTSRGSPRSSHHHLHHHLQRYPSSPSLVAHTPIKRSAQRLGARLKNLLKLPKAYRWCIHEWFYSNLDKPLFEGDNDFCICLKESFPQLKTRRLTRTEWCMIRRLMGKPRRCSPAFFQEEREVLEQKRHKLRLLQQRKNSELRVDDLNELPEEIPLPLCIGTKVTARLRQPHDGLFTGEVLALDPTQASYRIAFDRQGFGTHSIPDIEVLNNDEQETMPLATFLQKEPRPRLPPYLLSPDRFDMMSLPSPSLDGDPMLGMSPLRGKLQGYGETLGGFPINFLKIVTRLSKILTYKKEMIGDLRTMNTEAERMNSLEQTYPMEFKQRYANKVIELDQLNEDLSKYLTGVQTYCQKLAPELNVEPPFKRAEDRQQCEADAASMVERVNKRIGLQDHRLVGLITSLTALLLQVKDVATHGDMDSFGFKAITDFVEDIKTKIDPSSLGSFQDNVEVHMAHIQSGMTQMGNLHAFSERGYLY